MSAPTRSRVAALGGVAGCVFLAVATTPIFLSDGLPEIESPGRALYAGRGWPYLAVPVVAAVLGLCLPRWWPYLVLASGLLVVPHVLPLSVQAHVPSAVTVVDSAAYPLGFVGVLACAQGLARRRPGLGALVAGLAVCARLFGAAMAGTGWPAWSTQDMLTWHAVLLAAGFAGLAAAVWTHRRGDPDASATGGGSPWSWPRLRLLLAAGLALCVGVPQSFLTTRRLADLLSVSYSALSRRTYVESAVLGAIILVTVTILAAGAGIWALGGALTVATAQVAAVAPLTLAMYALQGHSSARLSAALGGVLLGTGLAASRWRFPLSGALTVVAATVLFLAYAATGGQPEKLALQRSTVPAELILVLSTATVAAVAGTTATVLAPRGTLPAVLGPLAAVLEIGGQQAIQATYLQDGEPVSSVLNPVAHLPTSGILVLAAGVATGGLGFAQLVAARRAERRHTEQIRQEAADAERSRLARPIHDGVLQVLALVQRQGAELGPRGSQLAALAGEQEAALRGLLTGEAGRRADPAGDLRVPLTALAAPGVEVATPAQPVVLAAGAVAELTAAVRAALDNVRRHAGPGARAWVLLEDEHEGVRVTVRDDGAGFPPGRLDEAVAAGRLGVAQSMRGRIADLGGTTTIHSRPGEGTEVEFWVPR